MKISVESTPMLNRRQARIELARLIEFELGRGQRGDGHPESGWRIWTNEEFGREVRVTKRTVRGWLSGGNPAVPTNIDLILDVFYGRRETNAAARERMLHLWHLAHLIHGTAEKSHYIERFEQHVPFQARAEIALA